MIKPSVGGGNGAGRYFLLPFLLTLIALLSLTSCAGTGDFVPASNEASPRADTTTVRHESLHIPPPPIEAQPYRIGPRDVLRVRDLNHPGLFAGGFQTTAEVTDFTVLGDGSLALPMVGQVEASGMTVAQLREELNRVFLKFVINPNISVTVKEYRSQRYFLLGQVTQPGVYPVDGDVTVLDALGRAKGLTGDADLSSSYILRGSAVLPVDFMALLRRGDIRYNIPLKDGDVVTIRSLADKKVYVLGEVRRPGVFPMGEEPMRLVDAIALAGGLNPVTANKGNILLIHGSYANPTITRISVKDILDISKVDTEIMPGDRIMAMPTGITNWNRMITQLLPFLQAGRESSDIRQNYVP